MVFLPCIASCIGDGSARHPKSHRDVFIVTTNLIVIFVSVLDDLISLSYNRKLTGKERVCILDVLWYLHIESFSIFSKNDTADHSLKQSLALAGTPPQSRGSHILYSCVGYLVSQSRDTCCSSF